MLPCPSQVNQRAPFYFLIVVVVAFIGRSNVFARFFSTRHGADKLIRIKAKLGEFGQGCGRGPGSVGQDDQLFSQSGQFSDAFRRALQTNFSIVKDPVLIQNEGIVERSNLGQGFVNRHCRRRA
jgi:hypothetical protein